MLKVRDPGSRMSHLSASTTSRLFRRSETSAAPRSEKASLLQNNAWDDDGDNYSTSVFVSPHKVKTDYELQERDRGSRQGAPDLNLVEMEVPVGSSMASLALKYNLPVAELKRVNNIINESELYALKRIKIPVKPNSVLTEILITGLGDEKSEKEKDTNGWLTEHFSTPPMVSASEVSSPVLSDCSEMSFGGNKGEGGRREVHVRTFGDLGGVGAAAAATAAGSDSNQTKKAKKFLRAMDKDLVSMRQESERLMTRSHLPQEPGDLNLNGVAVGRDSASASFISKPVKIGAVAVLVVVILAILWFARHEFELNLKEHPHKIV